jgi:hypothetical protein
MNHQYRATLIPEGTPSDEVEFQADQGLLPTLQVRSTDAAKAAADAHRASGRPVFEVVRIERS